jgi:hypothetical protein
VHRAGEDDSHFGAAGRRRGDQRGQLAQAGPLVRARRLARTREDRRHGGVEDHGAHRQRVGLLEAGGADAPTRAFGGGNERAERSLGGGHDREYPGRRRAGDKASDGVRVAGREAKLGGEPGVGGSQPRNELVGNAVDRYAGGQRKGPEEAPLPGDPPDEPG